MSLINFPVQYENSYGCLKQSGEFISALLLSSENKENLKVLIVAGKKAYDSVKVILESALNSKNILFTVEILSGFPTAERVDFYSKLALENNSAAIVGIGGGKALDTAKASAEKARLPVVTIPTIPATCAAWSALSVLYNEEGQQDIYIYLKKCPDLIIADKTLLKKSPVRYLYAGVADSLVKWYELRTNFNKNQDDFSLRLQLKIAELISEFLENDFITALDKNAMSDSIWENATDSIIMLAGLTGNIKGKVPYGGLAHVFYNQSTKTYAVNRSLHGEAVIFGLIFQFAAEKRDEMFIKNYINKLIILKQPVTLKALGFVKAEDVNSIADNISKVVPELGAEQIRDAILYADRLGHERS